jgi:hypothetical protein
MEIVCSWRKFKNGAGNEIMVEISYVTNFQQKDGYVVFGFVRVDAG